MKKLKIYSVLFLIAGMFFSCQENQPLIEDLPCKDVNFSYISTTGNYIVKESITFNNESVVGTTYTWDFGDGSAPVTVTGKEVVQYEYQNPATYTVTLMADNDPKKRTKKQLMISDIIPRVKVSVPVGVKLILCDQTDVTFHVDVENPKQEQEKYHWIFPKGTKGDGMIENPTTGQAELVYEKAPGVQRPVTVKFGGFGTQMSILQITIGTKQLEVYRIGTKVSYDKPAKTLYYAKKGGTIFAKKITDGLLTEDEAKWKNNAFDLGFQSGKHPFTMDFDKVLYVFDAGTIIGYKNPGEFETHGDGEIFSIVPIKSQDKPDINSNDYRKETIMSNNGGNAYCGFFFGYADPQSEWLYFADRRTGVRRIAKSTRNEQAVYTEEDGKYWVQNERLGYYNKGISWGNINGTIQRRGDVYWWAKNSTGTGICRFKASDILPGNTGANAPAPADGKILSDKQVRAFLFDEVNQHVYYTTNNLGECFVWRCDMNGQKNVTIDNAACHPEGAEAERVATTGIAIDPEGGYFYWAFKGDGSKGEASGIKRMKLGLATPTPGNVEIYIKDVEAYGLAIDQTLGNDPF